MENRIDFSRKEARRFFLWLKEKFNCKTFGELSEKLEIPLGRLKLYLLSERTIPASLFGRWKKISRSNFGSFSYKIIDMEKFYKGCGKKASALLKKRYGKNWSSVLGARGRKSLDKRFKKEPELHKKWRDSIKKSLYEKFGEDCYKFMGKKAQKALIKKYGKDYLVKSGRRLSKYFPQSISKRFELNGKFFRSSKEVELASFMQSKNIEYVYEKHICGFFPDFCIDNKILIEVVGFDWKPHIERTKRKIKVLKDKGYYVLIYTYPNMEKRFKGFPVFTKPEDIVRAVGFIRA